MLGFPPLACWSRSATRTGLARRAHVPVERIEFYEAFRCMVELVAVLEYRHHAAAKGNGIPKPPWDNGAKALAAHFAIITGVPLTIE